MDETIKWRNLSRAKIAELLAEQGYEVGVRIVDQLLDAHDFRRRQAFKSEAGKDVENRDGTPSAVLGRTATKRGLNGY